MNHENGRENKLISFKQNLNQSVYIENEKFLIIWQVNYIEIEVD